MVNVEVLSSYLIVYKDDFRLVGRERNFSSSHLSQIKVDFYYPYVLGKDLESFQVSLLTSIFTDEISLMVEYLEDYGNRVPDIVGGVGMDIDWRGLYVKPEELVGCYSLEDLKQVIWREKFKQRLSLDEIVGLQKMRSPSIFTN